MLLVANLGQLREDEHDSYDNQQHGQYQVRHLHGIGLRLNIGLPATGIVGRKRFAGVVRAAQDELAQEHGRNERSQSVERLGQIQPPGSRSRVAQGGDVRIGRRLQETHARSDDEEDAQVSPVLFQHGGRKEQQSAKRRQQQTEDDARLVAVSLHEHGDGDGEYEIGQPVGRLGERGLECIQFARLHQLSYHGGQQVAADGPQKEQRKDEHQGDSVILFLHNRSLLILTCS